MGVNTGFKEYNYILKVTDDANEFPLDINNQLCSVTGLPQARKENLTSDPNYISKLFDINSCPPNVIQFSFISLDDQPLNTLVESDEVEISVSVPGVPVELSISNGEYLKNNSGIWSSSVSSIQDGDFIKVRHTTSNLNDEDTVTIVTIGDKTSSFTSTTLSNVITYSLDIDNNSSNDIDFRIRDNTNNSIQYSEIIPTPEIISDFFTVLDDGNTMRVSIGNNGIVPINCQLSVDGVLVDTFTLTSGEVRLTNTVKSSVVLFVIDAS